jgi:transposase-like protein
MSSTPEKKTAEKPRTPRKSLTVAQKAEAAALWRTGGVTLDDLAKKFKKTPEMFSRLFTRMGVKKGEGVPALVKEAERAITARAVSDTEETLKRIAKVKDDHFKMSQSLAVMAFGELQRARKAELDIAKLKDTMAVYKMVSDVVANSRKELFDILNVEKHESQSDLDDLPDLTVRELTQSEIGQLRDAPVDDPEGLDIGDTMMELEDDE